MMSLHRIAQRLQRPPKLIFLIDALGALLTAVSWAVLGKFFGMWPSGTLVLTAAAACLSLGSWIGYFRPMRRADRYLRGIVCGNLGFCAAALGLAVAARADFNAWGWGYVAGECLVLFGLVRLEWLVAESLAEQPNR